MKQVIQNMKTGLTSVEDIPIPSITPGSVLVRTAASLVSAGTERSVVEFAEKNLVSKAQSRPDLVKQVLDKASREGIVPTIEAVFNRLDQPMTLGYSSAGTVVEVGEGVTGIQPGDRVACAGGNHAVHAEFALVPKNLIASIPSNVSCDEAAFTTLAAVAMQGFRLATPQVGEKIAVVGLGLLGLLSAKIALAAGCEVVGCDIDPKRIAFAKEMGIDAVINAVAPETMASLTNNHGADAVLICAASTSNDPIQLAARLVRDKGMIISVGAVGLDLERKPFFEKEITFLVSRSYGPGRYDAKFEELGQDYPYAYVRWTEQRNMESVLALMKSGKLDVKPFITHRFEIQDAVQAYELIKGDSTDYLGVLLTYPARAGEEEKRIALKTSRVVNAQAKVTLGVLGAGNYATATFLPIVTRDGSSRLHTIASLTGVKAEHAGSKFGFQHASADEHVIIDDPEINSVAILTRHDQHARQSMLALQAGKYVFCEKPMALNREELDALLQVINEHPDLCFTVGFNRRFAPLTAQLKAFLAPSPEPMVINYRVNAGLLPLSHWLHDTAIGGGRIIGEACHFIDLMQFLTGAKPVSVSAVSLPDAGKYASDNVSALIRFDNGSTGQLSYLANGDKAWPKEMVEVFCGGRIAVLDDFKSMETMMDGKRQVSRSARQDKGHAACWKAFVDTVSNGGPAPIPLDQLAATTLTTFAIMESLRTGATITV